MKLNEQILVAICDMEEIIAKECYNPSSYNGYTGEYGKWLRYPVSYSPTGNERDTTKTHWNINENSSHALPQCVSTMKYKFGANHLYIGDGIVNIMNYLENRYGIDFNALETQKRKKD